MNSTTLKRGKLPFSALPGPMEGVMGPLFCRAAERLNMTDLWMTPFLRVTTGSVRKGKIRKFLLPFSQANKPVILQIMGTDPHKMVETANRAKELGVAGINFNLACPSMQVLKGGCGAALLQNHDFIKDLLRESIELGKEISISLKIRAGLNAPTEIAKIAESIMVTPPHFIVMHFRTAAEGYKKVSGRNERIKKAVKLFNDLPLIANGDIASYSEAEQVTTETGCAAVMAARGWLKNPNLMRDIAEKKDSTAEKQQSTLAHLIHYMSIDIPDDKLKSSKNAILDMMRYAIGCNHPLFRYVLDIHPNHLQTKLSIETIRHYLR